MHVFNEPQSERAEGPEDKSDQNLMTITYN